MKGRSLACLCAAFLALACAETDRDHYPAGAPGTVTFHNHTKVPLYLGGCGHFDYEKRVGSAWVSQGPDVVCVWEGLAQPIPPRGTVSEPIETREPGTWRLRYRVGLGCSDQAPLGEGACSLVTAVVSEEFVVEDSGCAIGGCSGQACGEWEFIEGFATTCEWFPRYACYREARCGRFGPGGACGWEETPELLACLDENPFPPGW